MLDKLSWLHLSDFHFRADKDSFSQDVSTDEIKHDIASRLSDEFPLQFVAVTGDIAFSGRASEYDIAVEFFNSLASSIGLGLKRFFLVPGNHDVDRRRCPYLYAGVKGGLTSQQAVDDFLGCEFEKATLMERQAAFQSFQDRLFFDATTIRTEEGLARVRALDIEGLRVCILELNSAWLSGSDDRAGNLLIGERQMINALELAEQHRPGLMIALSHHPINWVSEFDQMSCEGRLLPHLDVFHSGHLHRHEVSVKLMPGSECLLVAAGSSHASRHYVNSYNLVEIEVSAARYRVRRFEYKPESGGFREIHYTEHRMALKGQLNASSGDITKVIREIEPEAEFCADYLAALLVGEMNHVPVKLDDGSCIMASRDLPSELQFEEVQEFLKISNKMRMYDDVQLEKMLSCHRAAIGKFSNLLYRNMTEDSEFARALSSHVSQARALTGSGEEGTPLYQIQYLDELATSGDWTELAETSRRYLDSLDKEVRVAANRRLTWALLRSDDERDRKDGFILAGKILEESWADSNDFIVAAAGAELVGDQSSALGIAFDALQCWPTDAELRNYCRSLAMQTGNRMLRQRLEETGGISGD